VGTTIAVLIAVSGRFSTGSLALAAVVLTVTAGFLQTFQQAVNGQVAMRTGDPLVATFMNFLVGTTALVVALAVEHLVLQHAWISPPAPWASPVLWIGGSLGIVWIMTAARVVRPLGVLLFALLSIGGQLVGSLVLDVVVPTPGTQVGWQLLLGVALTGAAVMWAAVRH
jgi:transporter family-2 protein